MLIYLNYFKLEDSYYLLDFSTSKGTLIHDTKNNITKILESLKIIQYITNTNISTIITAKTMLNLKKNLKWSSINPLNGIIVIYPILSLYII